MENNNELKIITDETLMEKRNHGHRHFRSNTIWKTSGISTFIRSVGIGIKKLNLFMCKAAKHTAVSEKIVFLCQQAAAYLSIRKYYINLQQSTPP